MANQERIEEFVSEAGFAQIAKLVKALEEANETMVKSILHAKELTDTLAKSGNFKDLIANQKKYEEHLTKTALAQEKLAQAKLKTQAVEKKEAADFEAQVQRQIAIQEKKAAKSVRLTESERLAEIKLDQDRKKAFDKYQAQTNKQNALDEKRSQVIAANSRPYAVLSNTLEVQRKKAQDLAIIYGENSKQFLNAAKGVIDLDTRLKAIDATLGKNQRNVGNYASGFSNFSHAINQLTRELPALAVNAQTFFLAISNNLPALFDAISIANKAKKESKEAAQAEAQAQYDSVKATELAGGATEEAASATADFAKQQALAAAEAIKTPGAFKQFLGSLFSLQTALSLGVILLTIYGAEVVKYIAELIKGGDATDIAAKKFENLNKAFENPSLADAVKNVAELKINIGLAKDGLIDKESVLNQYNTTIGKTTGEVQNLDEAEKALGKNAKAYVQMTLFKAAAQLTLDEAAKASVESARANLEREKNLNKQQNSAVIQGDKEGEALRKILVKDRKRLNAEKVADDKKANEELINIAEDFQKKAAEIAKQNNFDIFGGDQDKKGKTKVDTSEFDLQRARIQRQKDASKEIVDADTQALQLRLDALKVYISASEKLTDIDYKREVAEAKGNAGKILFLKEQHETDKAKVAIEGRKLEFKINEDAEKQLAKLLKDGLKDYEDSEKKKIEVLQVSIKQQQELLSSYADSALLGAAEQYAKGILNEKQYAKARLDIQRQYVLDSINEDIKGVQAVIDAKKKAGLDTSADEKALADLQKKLSKETTDQQITDLEKVAAKEKELRDKRKDLAFEVGELGISIVNGVFDNQKNKIQEEMDLADVKAQKEIEAVNNSVLTQEEKADKIAVIEARAAAQKNVFELQQRQLEERRARFEKAASIARIIANTAVGVTSALASFPPNVPLSILIGALGAVQVAQVLATPIPKYKDGKKKGDNYSGPAVVGDGFQHELRIDPNGDVSWTPNTPTLTNVSAGTQIIGGADVKRLMAKPPEMRPFLAKNQGFDLTPLIHAQENSSKKIIKALSNQKSNNTIITKKGWYSTQSKMNGIDDFIKRNFS